MPKVSPERRRLYTLLNIGWRHLGWSEQYYRETFLLDQGASAAKGKVTATSLTESQLEAALARMKLEGFIPTSGKKGKKPSGSKNKQQSNQPASPEQAQLIRDLWARLQEVGAVRSTDPASLRGWLQKNSRRHHPTGTGWNEPQFLNRRAAMAIIEQLKKWLRRLEK